jgi:hypothetical protein
LDATFESGSLITLSFQAVKQGTFHSGIRHFQIALPCHVRDAGRLPIANVLVEGFCRKDCAAQGVAARML